MNLIKRFLGTSFRTILIVIALLNLIALFVFNYSLPTFITSRIPFLSSATSGPAVTTQSGTGTLQLTVPDSALSYDGATAFDPTKDITILNADGTPSDAKVTYKIKEGNSVSQKTIEYTATGDNGISVHAKRALDLGQDYDGPSIAVSDKLTSVNRGDLNNLVAVLKESGMIQANDGFGYDITDSVNASASQNGSSGNYLINLSVKNEFGDSYSTYVSVSVKDATATKEKADSADSADKKDTKEPIEAMTEAESETETETEEALDPNAPQIKLTSDRITLAAGSSFNSLEYVASAKDTDGTELWENISVDGSVDTNTPGEYTVSYWCANYNGVMSNTATLTVEVN